MKMIVKEDDSLLTLPVEQCKFLTCNPTLFGKPAFCYCSIDMFVLLGLLDGVQVPVGFVGLNSYKHHLRTTWLLPALCNNSDNHFVLI